MADEPLPREVLDAGADALPTEFLYHYGDQILTPKELARSILAALPEGWSTTESGWRPTRVGPTIEEGQRSGARRWEVWGSQLVLRDENNGREFLHRWRLLQTPWFSVFVHRMEVPDPGADLHDHPWAFVSLVLAGGYTEVIADARRPDSPQRARHRRRWSIGRIRLDECHTVATLDRSPIWTLVVTGPTRRRWGFFVDGVWQDWEREYDYSRRYPWKAGTDG